MKLLRCVLPLAFLLPLAAGAQVQDLSDWSPAQTPRRKLADGWAFRYGAQSAADTAAFVQMIQLRSWDEISMNGTELPVHGCGTYQLHLRLPETNAPLALLMPFVWTAYRLEANGQTVAVSGNPDCDPARHEPQMLRQLAMLPEGTRDVTLTLHVADHDFFFAGMVEPPVLGTYQALLLDREFSNALNLGAIGGLLVMAVYHFLIYGYRRKERAMLYFGLICLAMMLRLTVFGDHYLYEWLNLYSGVFSFQVQVRAYYLLTVALVYFGLGFFRALFPHDTHPLPARIFRWLFIPYTLFALVVPLSWFTASLVGVQVVLIAGAAYLVFVLIRAAVYNRPDARYLLIGLSITLLAGVHDALQLAGVYLLSEEELLTFGFLCFLLVQFVVLSRRYSFAFSEVEDLSENLERKVEQRTEELQQANEEIARKNQDITDSIEYAKRIQLSILPKDAAFYARFPDSFLYYQPKDIVSGDFYWFRELGGSFLLCAADCTGHGVPGAFMSVLGSNLLHQVLNEVDEPAPGAMLQRLHAGVIDALQQEERGHSQDGMDLALCRIHDHQLTYAGANRPLLLVRGAELHELQPTKHAIGGGMELNGLHAEFHEHRLDLLPGDCLYLFTDGVTDQFGGEAHRKFSGKRLRQRLLEIHDLPMTQQRQVLHEEISGWRGTTPQTDDMLLIGIRIY